MKVNIKKYLVIIGGWLLFAFCSHSPKNDSLSGEYDIENNGVNESDLLLANVEALAIQEFMGCNCYRSTRTGRVYVIMRAFSFGFICVLFFLFACSEHSSTVPTFSVDVQQRDSIEHFFSSYDYVMLETNENALLGNVEKMKVDSSVIAVQDKGRILLFQHDGKFITKIDKEGRGAGEYLSVEDFCVKDSFVYVLSRAQRCILVYDWNADFVDKIDLDDWYQHFEVIDDGLMFLSSEKSNGKQYDFVVFNYVKSEYMDMFSPFENNEGITFANFTPFSGTFNGGYYVLRPFDYTVYRLSRTEFKPYSSILRNKSSKERLW